VRASPAERSLSRSEEAAPLPFSQLRLEDAEDMAIPSPLTQPDSDVPLHVLLAFQSADPDERQGFLRTLGDRRLEALRSTVPDVDVTPELETALRLHFARFDEAVLSQSDSASRFKSRVRLVAVTCIALLVLVAYTYAFVGSTWSVVQIAGFTAGIIASVGFISLAYRVLEGMLLTLSDAAEFGALLAIVGAFVAGATYIYWFIGRLLQEEPQNDRALYSALRAAAAGAIAAPVALMLLAALALGLLSVGSLLARGRLPLGDVPDSLVVAALFQALMVSVREDAWVVVDDKGPVLSALELAAQAVERGLPSTMDTRDFASQAWLKDQCEVIAASIRHLKHWICMPTPDTRSRFTSSLASFLWASASGSWDALRLDNVPRDTGPGMLQRVLETARVMLAGLAPLLISVLLLQQGFLSGALATPVLLFTGSLAFIVLMRLIDPQAADRLSSARELAGSFFKGSGSGG
jgi:hypothetical protein